MDSIAKMRYRLIMADGALNVKLSTFTASKLAEEAKAMGVTPEQLAAMVLDDKFFDYRDFTWINGDPRDDHAANHDLNETGRTWSDVRPEFLARMKQKLAEHR